MSSPVSLTTGQKVKYGPTVFDSGKPPVAITDASELPDGWKIEIVSSNPAVARIEMLPDGMNCYVRSDGVGTATVTGRVIMPDGTDLPGSPDTMDVSIKNAAPGQANFSVGAPEDEE